MVDGSLSGNPHERAFPLGQCACHSSGRTLIVCLVANVKSLTCFKMPMISPREAKQAPANGQHVTRSVNIEPLVEQKTRHCSAANCFQQHLSPVLQKPW